jgi:hypothetical protein
MTFCRTFLLVFSCSNEFKPINSTPSHSLKQFRKSLEKILAGGLKLLSREFKNILLMNQEKRQSDYEMTSINFLK